MSSRRRPRYLTRRKGRAAKARHRWGTRAFNRNPNVTAAYGGEAEPPPASARENQPYGSGVRGIQLFFSSPLVVMRKEFGSPLSKKEKCPPRRAGMKGIGATGPEIQSGQIDRHSKGIVRIPPGPLFLHDDVSEGVVLFGQPVSDGLLTPKRQGPLP